MSLMRCVAAAAAGLGLLVGCSSRPPAEVAPALTTLQDVDGLLRAAAGTTNRVPPRLADLDKHQETFPRGYAAVKSGDIVVLWGSPLKGEGEGSSSDPVVAYEKDVPTAGGYVLLAGTTVKKMSASDFNAARQGK